MKKVIFAFFFLPTISFAASQNVTQSFEATQGDCDRVQNESEAKLNHFISSNHLQPTDFNLEVKFHPGQAVYNPVDPIGRGPGDQTVDPPQSPAMCEISLQSKNPQWGFVEATSNKFKGRNRLHACGEYMSRVQTSAIVVDAYNATGLFGYCEITVISAVKM